MKCGRIKRWILRNGGDELPAEWRDHVAECEACRVALAQVQALDSALGDGLVPEPGEAYWDAFAPSVARRIDDLSRSSRPASEAVRPSWLKTWIPAVGAAALALLIARELVMDPRPRPVMENDVPVAVQKSADQPTKDNTAPEIAITATPVEEGRSFRRQPSQSGDDNETQPGRDLATDEAGTGEHAELSETPGTSGRAHVPDVLNPSPVESEAETAMGSSADDAQVWPDRRVTKMGEVDSDQTRQAVDAEGDLSELGTPTLADKAFGYSSEGAETSATLPLMGRLEAPRTYRASRAPDSQSPMDAMRRFDELRELRAHIVTLTAISPDTRTPEQNRELCAIWYRMGTITDNALVLDSAIQQLDKCLQTLDVPDSDEWQAKSEQLTARRAQFNEK